MRLLICTQTIDRPDSTLGFFCKWVEELAPHFERIEVICLKKGTYTLPENVSVYSLGKERGDISRARYTWRFFKALWRLSDAYEAVFVHMNQEYILLAGWLWKLFGKRVYLWRNHYRGSVLTRVAGLLCSRVFYTSQFSYTARFRNSVQMPVGVDLESIRPEVSVERKPRSILFLARLDESKRPHLLLEALGTLHERGVSFTATVAGAPSDPTATYVTRLKAQAQELGIADSVAFIGAVPNTETFRQYRSHEIFVNCSPSGMFDKTLFKAVACGCLVVATSRDFGALVGEDFVFEDGNATALANTLERMLSLAPGEKERNKERLSTVIQVHSLDTLIRKLVAEMHA